MVKQTSNKEARWSVEHLEAFKGSNTYGQTEWNGVYKVYSYGRHFPMFAYKEGKWYFNIDKYSRTTSKQYNQLKPVCSNPVLKNTEELQAL